MSKESRFAYPCLVNIRKDCPIDCPLYTETLRNTLRLANLKGETPEQYLNTLLSGPPELIDALNRGTIAVLRQGELLEQCENLVKKKIRLRDILNTINPS